MSNNSAPYPAVATIIGCPDQLNSANGLVATPINASGEIQSLNGAFFNNSTTIKDPIQRAVLENICGTLSTKHNPEYIRCEVCKVDCNGNAAYKSHLSGAKHSKRLKEQEMNQYLNLPDIRHNKDSNTFSCTLCGTTLNAVSQIAAHIEGQKHKNKAQTQEPIATSNSQINSGRDPSKPRVDATPNLLYCATCNIHVNSAQQLEQHTSSRRHINKVNGKPNFKKPFKWRARGGHNNGNSSYVGATIFPKISQNFVPGGQYKPY